MRSASQTIDKPLPSIDLNAKPTRGLHVVPFPIQELRIEQFPVWYFNGVDPSVNEISNLLDILIRESCERHTCDQVLIPSIIELSLYFQCPEIQVIDAFERLRRKRYVLFYDANYSKIYVKSLQQPGVAGIDENGYSVDSQDDCPDDCIDWRDITHDFLSDVVEPFKRRLIKMFA